MDTQRLTQVEEQKEMELAKIDFKMVTFTLAGKDYGIDIMRVKEIHKAQKFTFVPNSAPYVKGVYNMRGDIISVIDLRVFFNLPVTDNSRGFENMIILRLEDSTIGILVDSIEKVIGIDSSRKQPPHPLFGDINIKYIDGVVENDSSLYIILDAEKIFSSETKVDKNEAIRNIAQAEAQEYSAPAVAAAAPSGKSLNQGFIEETLTTYLGFHPSPMNRDWISSRYDSWIKQKGEDNFQLRNKDDAEDFLRGFFSPCTGQMWSDEILDAVGSVLPSMRGNVFVWNPGCGRGFETYSIASLIKGKSPDTVLKVQGNDNDLINISSAPGLSVDKSRISDFYAPYLVSSGSSFQFNDVIKNSILFEYSDLNNDSALPHADMVICRDTLCYLPEAVQIKFFDTIYENMKPGGLLVLGDNEMPISMSGWDAVGRGNHKIFKKN